MNLIVRGDLRSEFGAARHLRDQLKLFSSFFNKIYGIDLHYHPRFDKAAFPYEILNESEAKSFFKNDTAYDWIILHHVTPDLFIRFPKCYNLGYFVWETDKPPLNCNWEAHFENLDGLWVSSDFLVGVVRNLGWTKPIHVIPWPVSTKSSTRQVPNNAKLKIYRVNVKKISSISLKEFMELELDFLFSVLSDAPRKALPVLVSEWINYKKISQKEKSLLLKISTFNYSKSEKVIIKECQEFLKHACGDERLKDAGIFVISENLSENELRYFYDSCQAFVTATVGEGFGGPIAEAALMGKPVISPKHSSLEFLLPADYPLVVPHEDVTLSQGPNSFYAVSSKWGLIKAGALCEKLIQLDLMKSKDLMNLGRTIKNFVFEVCNPKKVKLSMEKFLKNEVHAIRQICNRR
jgi:hypothetical protein